MATATKLQHRSIIPLLPTAIHRPVTVTATKLQHRSIMPLQPTAIRRHLMATPLRLIAMTTRRLGLGREAIGAPGGNGSYRSIRDADGLVGKPLRPRVTHGLNRS